MFGLETPDLHRPFRIGALTIYPHRNVEQYLTGYDDDTVMEVVGQDVKLATLRGIDPDRSTMYLPQVHDALLPIRLWKPGWISAIPVMPVVQFSGMTAYQEITIPEAQLWAEPMRYQLHRQDLKGIRGLRRQLDSLPMEKFGVTLRRFSRSYEYRLEGEVDDCLVDLVIALESITSRGGDSIGQSMALRTALLVERTAAERGGIERRVKKFYDHRSQIVHGGAADDRTDEARFMDLEDLRSLVRDTIRATLSLFLSGPVDRARTVAEAIDLFLYQEVAVKK